MAASHTVSEVSESLNSRPLVPRHGVLTLSGYGIVARVERGHLILDDGIGPERQHARLARIGHGLRRLVVIGHDGMISLAALRWLIDQHAAFVMLDREGTVLATAGDARSSDARLRRAQALAVHTGSALPIVRDLIDRKIAAQERVALDQLRDAEIAAVLADARVKLRAADSTDAIRLIEANAGQAYWSAWRALPIRFPQKDVARTPDHWRVFGARRSPISGSQRLAINPANAMLNYLYAIVESEALLAAAIVGLDPSLGVLHADQVGRDNLACDLMEPIRPQVDAYVLDWVTRTPLRREWFFEQRDGSCRLMAPFARQLAESAPMWARAVAPVAERVAEMLWATTRRSRPQGDRRPAVLTQQHRRAAKGPAESRANRPPTVTRACLGCGVILIRGQQHCADCARARLPESFEKVMAIGRASANSPRAQAKRSATQRAHNRAVANWNPQDQPAWLTLTFYVEQIQPRVRDLPASAIARALGVSKAYAAQIRAGKRRPHPRHWVALTKLVGLTRE
jgi:CRISPR-associated endonuclease Cas1